VRGEWCNVGASFPKHQPASIQFGRWTPVQLARPAFWPERQGTERSTGQPPRQQGGSLVRHGDMYSTYGTYGTYHTYHTYCISTNTHNHTNNPSPLSSNSLSAGAREIDRWRWRWRWRERERAGAGAGERPTHSHTTYSPIQTHTRTKGTLVPGPTDNG